MLLVLLLKRTPIRKLVCGLLPMMKARHPCLTFLRLRVVCREMLPWIVGTMAWRIILYRKGMPGFEQAQRLERSGFLKQCWYPCGSRCRLQPRWLEYDQRTGIPLGMSQRYFDNAHVPGGFGWRHGRLFL